MKSRGNAACPCGQVLAGATLRPPRAQIVVGVLVKYVNLAKGWRHRLFVLQNGVLRYYKARAPWGVPIGAPLASSARRCGRRPSRAPAALPKAAAAPDAAPARRCSAPRASTCTRCWRACGSRATWCSSARRPASRRTSGYGAPALGPSASCARARACTALDWEARALPPAQLPPSTLQCAAVLLRRLPSLLVGQAARALPRPLLSPVQGISSMVTGTHRASPGAAITPSTRFPHMQEVETLLLASRVMYKVRCPEHGMPCFKRNRLLLTLMLPLPLPWHDV